MTYLRLPIERFMFTASDHTDEILPLGDVRPEHARAAREYLKSFRSDSLLPYVRPSSITWGSVLRRLPLHFAAGWQLLLQARYDAGNRFARYPLIDIAKMYLRKKRNLLQANLFLKTHDEASNRPYVLFGLHRQPESSIDVVGAYFSDQTYLIRTIARSIPAGYDLLVKVHISDADGWPLRFYRTLEAIPAVRLISPTSDTRKLLLGAELTVTNSGTMAYEAGLLGRPAITFSRVHYNELPTIRYCTSPTELPELIDELLRRGRKPGDDVAIEAFLARMYAWSAPGLPNREIFSVPLTDLDLESLINAYEALFARHAQRREPRNAIREA
jgi:hypothetical protein